jgi:haloacetate dehalogenase
MRFLAGKFIVPGLLFACAAESALAQPATTSPVNFFPGFQRQTIQTSGTTINVLVGGDGPPVLLLHGYPQTHSNQDGKASQLAASECRQENASTQIVSTVT